MRKGKSAWDKTVWTMKLPEIEKETEEMRPFLDREPHESNGAAKAQKTATAAETGQNRTEAALTGTETGQVGKDANPVEKETRPFGLDAKTRTELQSLRPQAQQAANEYAAAEAAAAEEKSWTRVLKTPEALAGLRRWYEDLGFHEIDGLASASEVGEFLETEYGTFSEAGDRYRALMKKVVEETATEEERKQYERLCRRRMYAEDRKETLTAYEADRQYREEKARYESPLGRTDLRESVEAGLEADGNPLTGSVLSALSPRVFRTKTYTTTDEKILISYYYGQSKAKGDEYVEWLDKHELKERDRSAKVNAITKLAKVMPTNPLLPVPTKYWVAATSGVERFVLGGYNLVAGITGGETVEGILTGAYNQLLQDENWASKKLMKLTNTLGNAAPKVAIWHFAGASAAYGAYAASSMGNKYHQAKSTGYTEPEAWLYAGITTGVEMAMGHKLGQQGGGQLGRMIDEALRGITRSPRGRAVLNLTAEKAGGLTGTELQKYFGGTLAPVVRDIMQSEGMVPGLWSMEMMQNAFIDALEKKALSIPGTAYGNILLEAQVQNGTWKESEYHGLPIEPFVDEELKDDIIIGKDGTEYHGYGGKEPDGGESVKPPVLPSGYSLGEGYATHMTEGKIDSKQRGVIGGHNRSAFERTLREAGFSVEDCVISVTEHPEIKGVYEIEYRIPKKGYGASGKLEVIPGQYKRIDYPKTVYDPAVISDEQMRQWGIEAMEEGILAGRIDRREIRGYARNGLKFVGYLDLNTNEITNFFPTLH